MFVSVCSGRPVQPSVQISPTQHTITIPSASKISHVTLFTLPNQDVPLGYKALIFFKVPGEPDFKLFGGISIAKPSAIFKLNNHNKANNAVVVDDIDMDIEGAPTGSSENEADSIVIGISIEPDDVADAQLQQIRPSAAAASNGAESTILTLYNPNAQASTPTISLQDKAKLANNIVKHIYNYLTGFIDDKGMVNIKVFDAWWDKFKVRVLNDAKFLTEDDEV